MLINHPVHTYILCTYIHCTSTSCMHRACHEPNKTRNETCAQSCKQPFWHWRTTSGIIRTICCSADYGWKFSAAKGRCSCFAVCQSAEDLSAQHWSNTSLPVQHQPKTWPTTALLAPSLPVRELVGCHNLVCESDDLWQRMLELKKEFHEMWCHIVKL